MQIEDRIKLLQSQGGKADLEEMDELAIQIVHAETKLETAKLLLSDAKAGLEPIAAKLWLDIDGNNAETRKANYAIAQASSAEWKMHEAAVRAAEQDIIDQQDGLSAVSRRFAVMRLRVAHKTAQLHFLSGGN